ncbi:hypothetical protein OIDMADRAFT_33926 [Oidiodendron maius Zn]|uniref:Uncharacterized protein n=1 Tax=Oidiodendron maius (strain Zn) TaxID=913774 RepID=A0A0C3CA88_OIDMZ|nr:hypothetical protein OIDMADRAFT_33926 [Oidiodendron maius Zn]
MQKLNIHAIPARASFLVTTYTNLQIDKLAMPSISTHNSNTGEIEILYKRCLIGENHRGIEKRGEAATVDINKSSNFLKSLDMWDPENSPKHEPIVLLHFNEPDKHNLIGKSDSHFTIEPLSHKRDDDGIWLAQDNLGYFFKPFRPPELICNLFLGVSEDLYIDLAKAIEHLQEITRGNFDSYSNLEARTKALHSLSRDMSPLRESWKYMHNSVSILIDTFKNERQNRMEEIFDNVKDLQKRLDVKDDEAQKQCQEAWHLYYDDEFDARSKRTQQTIAQRLLDVESVEQQIRVSLSVVGSIASYAG